MLARRVFLLVFAVALPTAFGCGGGGGGNTPTAPVMTCDDGGVDPNTVTLSCGGFVDSGTVLVDVVIAGASSSTQTIRGLNFDVTYDPSRLSFVSATNPAGGPFSTSALLAATAVSNPTPRVVVSIQQVFSDPSVDIAPGQQLVALKLTFSRVPDVTFAAADLKFDLNASETTPTTTLAYVSSLFIGYQ